MATKYNVFTTDGENAVAVRAKKESAITWGLQNTDGNFRVVTDSGKLVHHNRVEDEAFADESAPETDEQHAAEPEPQPEPSQAEEAPAPEPSKAKPAKKATAKKASSSKRADRGQRGVTAEDVAPAELPEPDAKQAEELASDVKEGKGKRKLDLADAKRKIAKILAKAEGTDNEHERQTFNAAAQRMMLRLGIDAAELEADGGKPEQVVQVTRHYKSVYAKTMANLGHNVCRGFGNLMTLHSGKWSDTTLYIIGHKTDVEMVTKLLDSLDLQVMSGLVAWQKSDPEGRKAQRNYDRLVGSRSFIDGFGVAVMNRLTEARASVEEEASTGAALVLASKMDRVLAERDQLHPKIGKERGGKGRYSTNAMIAGHAEGKKANLGEKAVGDTLSELL